MQYNSSPPTFEKERFFHTELVKYGVKYDRAAKAAKILASGKPDELLTEEEKQLTTEVCNEWLEKYKRKKKKLYTLQ